MSLAVNPTALTPTSKTRKQSNAAKLLHAAALAAVLVPLGSVAAEATSIT